MRNYTLKDKLCIQTDKLLRMMTGFNQPDHLSRANPASHTEEPEMTIDEKKHVAGLMRINYAGEVCAQALYQGQALTAKNWEIKQNLEKAGLEEQDHLLWCQSRLNDLNSHVSLLNPLWYAGSFLLGVSAGIIGDQWNLGFLEETEQQVCRHLEDHLQKIPKQDEKTRTILLKMRDEEAVHAEVAHHSGAKTLPKPLQFAMKMTAKIMTTTAYRI